LANSRQREWHHIIEIVQRSHDRIKHDSRPCGNGAAVCQCRERIAGYFAGRLRSFSAQCDVGSLPVFTQAVLHLTAENSYGELRSYAWLARKFVRPKAGRAVGKALARNRVPIIIPCHRVVRADRKIGRFALGSASKKRMLRSEKSFVITKTSQQKPHH